MRFDSQGTLYVVDPFNGVFTVNVSTGEIKLIIDAAKIGALFLDDLVLVEKERGHLSIYLTDVSTKWNLHGAVYCVMEHDRTGRLIRYDTRTQKVTVEYENLAFPNGLELTDDRSAILLASINDRLVYKYYIAGEKKGSLITLIDNLPGEPDNIKRSADRNRETYWVALYTGRNKHMPHFEFDVLGQRYPILKRFTARLQRLAGFLLEKVSDLIQCDCLQKYAFLLKHSRLFNLGTCKYGMAIEIDVNGGIVSSMHSPDGSTCSLSEVFELEQRENDGQRRFLLGSAVNPYLGRLTVPKSAFTSSTSQNVAQSKPIVVAAVPKDEDSKPSKVNSQKPKTTPPKEKVNSARKTAEKHEEL